MTSLLRLGQILKGRVSSYTITKRIQDSVWLASNLAEEKVIIKSVRHWCLQNECDILHRFQARAPSMRPIVDEIVDPSDPPAIVLKHLDDDVLHASSTRRFTTAEIKYIAKTVLQALEVLHEDGFVHTDIKPNNVLVNYSNQSQRISDTCLADFGSTVREDSEYAREGFPIGTPIFRSPEAALRLKWDRATDIWSFGTTLISMIWGLNWHIFKPDVPTDHEHYELKILMKHCQFFGPYPSSYQKMTDEDTQKILAFVMEAVKDVGKPFHLIRESEISKEDKAFVLKIMQLDPRDRPSAKQLLDDEWFADVEKPT
ncbi:hypothetical protein ONS96_013982 [Cadophora gregata f. sp. sojae]|nr:hypothetical protein ONS96_013982 [Cadophora gregata f. sp. sojae]